MRQLQAPRTRDGLGLAVEPVVDEEAVHVGAQQGGAHQVREAQLVLQGACGAGQAPGGGEQGWGVQWLQHMKARGWQLMQKAAPPPEAESCNQPTNQPPSPTARPNHQPAIQPTATAQSKNRTRSARVTKR